MDIHERTGSIIKVVYFSAMRQIASLKGSDNRQKITGLFVTLFSIEVDRLYGCTDSFKSIEWAIDNMKHRKMSQI